MLQVHDLKVALDAEAGLVKAIDGLRLTIARGETFALVGESGCGKSMTALALMRLLPDNGRVTQGSLHVEGEDVFALPESRMRSVRGGKIGMIFQEPSTSLNPVKRVGEQIVDLEHRAVRPQTGTLRRSRGRKLRARGSNASRTPSANRFAASTSVTMKPNAAAKLHQTSGSRLISLRARLIMPPKLFIDGSTPTPT